MKSRFRKRTVRLMWAVGILTAALAVPATATPDDGDGHKVTICHMTHSDKNPYVVITVDVAAFEDTLVAHLNHGDLPYENGECVGEPTD